MSRKPMLIPPTDEEDIAITAAAWMDPDNPPLSDLQLNQFKRPPGRPPGSGTKVSTTVRFDTEVVTAFRATGKGWQTRMNAALKEWLASHPQGA